MLNNYLEAEPSTKFILIQDCLQQKGHPLVDILINYHQKLKHEINYCVFEGNFSRINRTYSSRNINCSDFTRSFEGKNSLEEIEGTLRSRLKNNSVVILNSLVHLIYLHGFVQIYKVLNTLIKQIKDGQQIIAILHTDLLEDNEKIVQYMGHLATLSVTFDPECSRVYYTYKKIGGRIYKQIEEYKFEQGRFSTEPLKKPDVSKIVQEKVNEVSPENLTTFKIGLTQTEKEARDNLVLPYLPKDTSANIEDPQIFYKFDEIDDWDEEDPDDDLDI